MRNRRLFPAPLMIVALLALVVAIGGTAFAATKIGTGQLKNKAVSAKKLKKNAVKSSKIKNKAVKTKKLANAAVDGSKVKDETLDDSKISDYELLGDSFVRVPATDGASFAAARSAAPENPLFSEGPFEIYAKCLRAGNVTQGEIYARTSIDRSLMEGTDDLGGGPARATS